MIISNLHKSARISIRVLILSLCLLSALVTVTAQAPYFQKSASTFTPLAEQPGAPVGSYPLSGFDNVNLFNGHLNFRLPLMHIGGRGSAGYTMMLTLEQQWQVQTVAVPICNQSGCSYPESNYRYIANPIWWSGIRPGFSPGVLQGRQSGTAPAYAAEGCSGPIHFKTLTRLTFTGADGTETELRDTKFGGEPIMGGGCSGGPSRGKVFVSADGSAMTFISEADILDERTPQDPNVIYPSGYLLFRDGTRYRIDSGKVSWIRDNNGNKISFTYTGTTLTGIDDSLNRHISISGGVITFKGADGETRTIKVYSDSLGNALRKHPDGSTEYTLKTFAELFSFQNPQNGTFNTGVTTAVELPDGRKYQFRYDSYANLAQVILPTGGRIDYDWANLTYQSGDHVFGVINEVNERRTALNTTTTSYETKTRYSTGGFPDDATLGIVDVLDPKNNDALISRTKHYFYGNKLIPPDPLVLYPKWTSGLEYQTELLATDGATVLRRVNNTWQQRAVISWWTGSANDSPANDPRLVETTTTLVDTNQVSKTTSIDPNDPNGVPGFDQYNNQTKVWEFDYGPGAPGPLIRKTVTSFLTSGYDALLPNSTAPDLTLTSHIRNLPSQISVYDAGNVERARAVFEYDNYVADSSFHANLVPRIDICGHDNAVSTYNKRGNATAVSNYLLPAGTAITTYNQFDIAGNIVRAIDPRSTAGNIIAANIVYDDNFGGPDNSLADRDTITELGSQHTFAFPTQITNALNQSAFTQYDYYLGQAINTQDLNGVVAAGYHIDSLDRLTQIRRGIGTTAENQTTFQYDDPHLTVYTTSDLVSTNDNILISSVVYDGLGRTIESRKYENGTDFIASQTQYDGAGRPHRTSNPFRPNEDVIWTVHAFDALGRVTSVTTPDGASVSTSYQGNSVIVTDQTGKRRKSVTDALGRLTDIWEDPQPQNPAGLNYQTTYTYDALDNLVKVNQGGQLRFFLYDSLKRLIRSRNPEHATLASLNLTDPITGNSAWSTGYQYDVVGNLTQKTDPRGVVSTYVYDLLNRNTTIDYSNTAVVPDVTRIYDGAGNGIGRVWKSYTGGTESNGTNVERTVFESYDALGRPLVLNQSFKLNNEWKPPYQVIRTYNRAGQVLSQIYPSGHFVNYNYDNAGRLANKDLTNLAFTGTLGDGNPRTYSRNISYESAGQMTQEQFGTNKEIYHKLHYNWRQQLAEILVSTTLGSSYDRGRIVNRYGLQCSDANCNPTDNNGNLRKQQIDIPTTEQATTFVSWYQQYDYDALNRLQSVREVANNNQLWRQWFAYDRWGNRTIDTTQDPDDPNPRTYGTGINNTAFQKEDTTNRLYAPGDLGLPDNQKRITYDAAGNQIKDIYTGFGSATFDAENHITDIQDKNGATANYTYNADGQRTRRKVSNQENWQVYGMDGELVAEYAASGAVNAPQKEYGYRNGQLLVVADVNGVPIVPEFSDDFNDNSLSTVKWSVLDPNSPAAVSEQNQQLQIAVPGSTSTYNGVISVGTYSMEGKMVQLEVPQVVSQAGWVENALMIQKNASNYFLINVGASNLLFRSMVNGANDQLIITYNPASHRFWRIRHDQTANTIAFETSGNGTGWTTQKTVNVGFALTGLKFQLHAGAYGTGNANPGAAKYDDFKLVNSQAAFSTLSVSDSGFETPSVGAGLWQFSPTGGSWTFASGAGLSANGSAFTSGNPNAPEGSQVAFLQGTLATITQSVSGFQSGVSYSIIFKAAQRGNCCNAGGQDFQVYIDNQLLGIFHPTGTSYLDYDTPAFTVSAGAHTIKFAAVNPLGGDHTAFIDNVRVVGSTNNGAGIQWLVSDQLGTPRMVIDQTGSVAGINRHDYLPFGEELYSQQGLRTESLGYSTGDGVRQQFTSKERDLETNLDYFFARYYSATQGRFTSADELVSTTNPVLYADTLNPQSLNKYQYVNNNPMNATDPDGHCPDDQPCPLTTRVPITNPFFDPWTQRLGLIVSDINTGQMKSAANIAIGANNLSNHFLAGDDPRGAIKPFEAASKFEYLGKHTADVLSVVGVLLEGFGPFSNLSANTEQTTVTSSQTGNLSGARELGFEGESLSGIPKNTQRIPSDTGTAKYRIPDGLNWNTRTLSEVKNVRYQSLTNQLRDNLAFVQKNPGFRFDLHVRSTTRLSGPLQQQITAGNINLRTFNPKGFKF